MNVFGTLLSWFDVRLYLQNLSQISPAHIFPPFFILVPSHIVSQNHILPVDRRLHSCVPYQLYPVTTNQYY
jgi:hypothetical protein